MNRLILGCVADDFTGASDAASFIVRGGLRTVLFNGIPGPEWKIGEIPHRCVQGSGEKSSHHCVLGSGEGVQAVVIALKTRTLPRAEAVAESLAAFWWLRKAGAEHLYFKYCSTFDSTKEGNIGPVTDAVLEGLGIPYTLLCPSLPVNGRTVKGGVLYVNGVPLHESHMKDHPLTPMWASRVCDLMDEQGSYKCLEFGPGREQAERARAELRQAAGEKGHVYGVPDYYEDGHGSAIAEVFCGLPFLTGGSGLAGELARCYARELAAGEGGEAAGAKDTVGLGNAAGAGSTPHTVTAPSGTALSASPSERHSGVVPAPAKTLLLAGSCSAMTLKQIEAYRGSGAPCIRVAPQELMEGRLNAGMLWSQLRELESPPLVYSSASPDELKKSREYGREKVAAAIEDLLSSLARLSVESGYTRIVSAGGETSGAVTRALGYHGFIIGRSVAPGVPVMTPLEDRRIRLVLKSGNFGHEDFFTRAIEMMEEEYDG